MDLTKAKVTTMVASSVISLAAGIGAGMFVMTTFGYRLHPGTTSPKQPGGMVPLPGGAGGPRGAGGRVPNYRNQLASLVVKLDVLTGKPLVVSLSADQRKKIREQLAGVEGPTELDTDDSKKRLEALLEVVKDQRQPLEAAGYRWPGQGFRMPTDSPNPFKEEQNAKHLKSLQGRLVSGKDR